MRIFTGLHKVCKEQYQALEKGRDEETDCYQQDMLNLMDDAEKYKAAIEMQQESIRLLKEIIKEKDEELELLRAVVVDHDRHCLPSL